MIEVKHITKKYGNFKAVDDISFEIKDNEVVGFLGPNGAGKSTTMNMITGYVEPTSGKILVNGKDISKEPNKVKKQIGYMPENVPLYQELTVREFVNYMADLKYVKRKEKKEKVDKILEDTGLTNVQKKIIKNLSRGYKQRVSLAGALIGNPGVLILDEPTVGLDPKQITEIRELIKKLGKKHTVILSSHILSEVSQICEKVIIINKGKILAVDTPENLENKFNEENGIYLTVEDKNKKIEKTVESIKEVNKIKLIKENQDGTKQYLITANSNVDLRKELFNILPKNDINIVELKKTEITLEDAFLKLISNKEEEMEKKKKEEEEKLKKRQEELNNMSKEERKEAIKKEKKEAKEKEKEEFNKKWEEDKKERKEEKNRVKEIKKNEKNKKKETKENQKKLKKDNNKKEENKKEKKEKKQKGGKK